MRAIRQSIFYRMSVLTGSGILLNLLGFCYRIFLSRTTGADGMGVYQLVLPFYSVLQALTLSGLTMAVSSLAAEERAKGSLFGAQCVLTRARRVFLLLFVPTALFTLFGANVLSETVLGDARTRTALFLLLPCLLLTGFENLMKNYFYGVGETRPPITSELTEQIVRFAAVALLLLCVRPQNAGASCACIVLGMVISEVVSVVLLSQFYHKARPAPTHTALPQMVSMALPVTASALTNNLLSSCTAVLIPKRLMAYGLSAHAAISEYGVLFGMTLPLLSLPFALLGGLPAILIPKLTEGMSGENRADVRRKAGKALHVTGLLAFPLTALMLPLANLLSQALYQQKTAESYLLPLCLATFFGFYQLTSSAILNGIGRQRNAALHILLGGLIQLGFTWSVGSFGMMGFVIGDLVSTVFITLLNLHCVIKTLGIRVPWRNWVVTPFLASVLCYLTVRVTSLRLVCDRVPLAPLIAAAVGLTLYFAALRVQGTSLFRYLSPLLPKAPSRTPRSHRV